eukprot:767813-Prymnesium_polylepis.2
MILRKGQSVGSMRGSRVVGHIGRQQTQTLLDVTFRAYVHNTIEDISTQPLRDIPTSQNNNFQKNHCATMRSIQYI